MSTEEIEKVGEVIVDAAEGIYVSRAGMARVGVLFGLTLVGTGYLAYRLGHKKAENECQETLQAEIASAKTFYSVLNKEGFETPERAAAVLIPKDETDSELKASAMNAISEYQGKDEPDEDDESSTVNVFLASKPAEEYFDYATEIQNRSSDAPYIITEDEFMENSVEYSQSSLTYYAGDAVLADDRDQEIPLVDEVVGKKNLERFGHGSGDALIVFVRNEAMEADFEIALSDGKYAHEVLGFQHSEMSAREIQRRNQTRKPRGSDW